VFGTFSPNTSLSAPNEVFTHIFKLREEQIKCYCILWLYQTRIMINAFLILWNLYCDVLDGFLYAYDVLKLSEEVVRFFKNVKVPLSFLNFECAYLNLKYWRWYDICKSILARLTAVLQEDVILTLKWNKHVRKESSWLLLLIKIIDYYCKYF
jgi:hypothetical protein